MYVCGKACAEGKFCLSPDVLHMAETVGAALFCLQDNGRDPVKSGDSIALHADLIVAVA